MIDTYKNDVALITTDQPQGVDLSGEGLGLEGILPSRSKGEHLLDVNNFLGPHVMVKSQ